MNTPSIRYADDIKNLDTQTKKNNNWVLARPEPIRGLFLFWRLRLAWRVFKGDCDVLAWKGGQGKI